MSCYNRMLPLPDDLLLLVWGPIIRSELFYRWSQGFIFSGDENSALIQTSGGPCAVIAPVQAFLLQKLTSLYQLEEMRQLDDTTLGEHLASTLSKILHHCSLNVSKSSSATESHSTESSLATATDAGLFYLACLDDPVPQSKNRYPNSPSSMDDPVPSPTVKDHERFHSSVRLRIFECRNDLEDYLQRNIMKYKIDYGILLFMYSIILTKGVNRVRDEMGEGGESLIERTEGHGSQALINLLICGTAFSYVWDGDKNVDGLKLCGAIQRPSVGFLTRMEELQYVQVGWYLKNPYNPIWVLASETHLTVLFSWCKALVTPDTDMERAKQILSWFDADGNHFIQRLQFKEVLHKLNLCTDDDFVDFMCRELDPENVGIILFHKILEAFYNIDESFTPPDTFKVYHFNGIESSCRSGKVEYAEGIVTIQESHVGYSSNSSEVLACLNTKWPNLDIQWLNFHPSLN